MKSNALRAKEVHRLLDLTKTKKYERRQYQFKPNLHWGQLKLLLTEIEFLTIVLSEYKGELPIYFVYAGAAPGDHIWYLQLLFPTIYFELYDPNDFSIKDNDKLKTHVQFFTNKDAEYWRSRNDIFLVFCSDIRTEPASSENIINNMAMQLKWWQIMNPELSMFKFRLPWEEGKTQYPEGEIYIQPFPGPTSTETRLVVRKGAKLIDYDNIQYEGACFYHNTVDREKYYETSLGHLNLDRDGFDNCYDCAAMIEIIKKYLAVSKLDYTVRELITDMQENITASKHTIKSQTIRYLNETFSTYKKLCYMPCRNRKCPVCSVKEHNPIAKGFSKATVEAESAAMKSTLN